MAKSRNIGGIYAELSLKDGKFRRSLSMAEKGINGMIRGVGRMAKGLTVAGAAAGTAMAAGLAAGTKKTIAAGAELDHLASQTGVAVSSLMKIRQAYKDSGKSAETAGKDINKMQRAIADAADAPGTTLDYFTPIGLSAEKLLAMSPEEQFFKIAEAIKSITNPTRQAQAAMEIFGRSGGELLTVFKGSNFDDVTKSLGRMPEIMQQFSGAMERVDTLMGRLPNKSDQFFAGFTTGVIGQILPALESVNDKDFTELGEKLGEAVSSGLELLMSGDVWDIFSMHAEIAILKLDQKLGGLMNSISAHLLAGADFITGKDGPGIAGYSAAGLTAEQDIKDLQSRIAEVLEKNVKKSAEKKARVAETGPPEADFLPAGADLEKMGFTLATATPVMPTPEPVTLGESAASSMMQSAQVNSMQARGLAQGGVFISRGEQKQIAILGEIKDAILGLRNGAEPLTWRAT